MLDKRVFIWYNKLQDMKGDVFMAQISFRVDDDVKMSAEQTLDTIGLSMSSVLNVFLKTIARENAYLLNLRLIRFILQAI